MRRITNIIAIAQRGDNLRLCCYYPIFRNANHYAFNFFVLQGKKSAGKALGKGLGLLISDRKGNTRRVRFVIFKSFSFWIFITKRKNMIYCSLSLCVYVLFIFVQKRQWFLPVHSKIISTYIIFFYVSGEKSRDVVYPYKSRRSIFFKRFFSYLRFVIRAREFRFNLIR